jgi:hypothetical protein
MFAVKLRALTVLVCAVGLGLVCACACGCNREASGDVVALDGNVELRAPKGLVAQPGRVSRGIFYADPKAGDGISFGRAGTEPSNCQASAGHCVSEYDEIIFRCVADGPPHAITPERARDLGFSIPAKATTTLFTQDVRGIRVLTVGTHEEPSADGSETYDGLDAYVFTGAGAPADIRVFGSAREVDRYGARVRESIASLRSNTPVPWTSPSAEECKRAAARKQAVETHALPWSDEDQDVSVAPGALFGVSVRLVRTLCPVDFVVTPPTIAILEDTTSKNMPASHGPWATNTTRATFLARASGDGTLAWSCPKEEDGKRPHGSIALHVGTGATDGGD